MVNLLCIFGQLYKKYPMKQTLRNLFFIFSGMFFFQPATAQLVINEYSCSNLAIQADNYGKYSDFIELYNAGATTINLTGYHLSDNISNPGKYTFPSGSITAGGRLRVWCTNRDTLVSGNYHTNFKLTQMQGEKIVLADPSVVILDSLTLNPTQANHSRGRTTDGAATWSLFTTPTPNAANAGAVNEYVPRPVMDIQPGFYSGAGLTVSITCSDPSAEIRWTINGSTPTTTSTLYGGPISIVSTTVIRARAFSSVPNTPASLVESNTYFINSPHGIAVLSVFGDQIQTLLGGSGSLKPQAGLEYFDETGTFRTEAYGTSNEHGNDSWAYAQRGFDYIAKDEYGYNDALKHQLFTRKDRTEFDRLIVKAAANDNYPFGNGGSNGPAHVRDAYVHTLSQRSNMHMDERTSEWAVVYVNGQYWGVYDYREKVDDKDFLDYYHNQNEKYDGSKQYIQYIKTWGSTWAEYGTTQAQTDWSTCRNYITSNNMAITANYDSAKSMFNVKSLVDYFVLNSYVVCSDWLNWNTSWWRGTKPTGNSKKWRYSLWDMDATFGHYINYTGVPTTGPSADPCDPQSLSNPGGQGHVPILNALLANQEFKDYYISRFIDLHNTTLNCTYMKHLLDSMLSLIAPEMPRQITRWGGAMAGWQNNIQQLKTYMDTRCTEMAQGLIDCYTLNGPYTTTFIVDPPGFGNIKVNSIVPSAYPYTGSYFGGVPLNLEAETVLGTVFIEWQTFHHALLPDTQSSTISISSLSMPDTIIAHFSVTGIPQVVGNGMAMRVYPSAVTNNFFVELETKESSNMIIEMHSLTGNLVGSIQPSLNGSGKQYIEIDPSRFGLASGMYLVSCRNETGKVTQKIVYLPQ